MSSPDEPGEKPLLITVLISGSGTNLQALIDASLSRPARIIRVISNRRAAYGLERARAAGIQTGYHNLKAYRDRAAAAAGGKPDDAAARALYDDDLAELILRDVPDLVVCAGWMHIFSARCLETMEARGTPIINLHPYVLCRGDASCTRDAILCSGTDGFRALPGQFNGANAIQRAHEKFMSDEGLDKTGVSCRTRTHTTVVPEWPH